MCNEAHGKQPKKTSGTGWKVFIYNQGNYYSMVYVMLYNINPDNEWVVWKQDLFRTQPEKDYGFCIFARKKDAEECCRRFKEFSFYKEDLIIKKVCYEKAVSHHYDHIIEDKKHFIIVAKQFKIYKKL